MVNNDYYVYVHRNPLTKEVFYVGKGRRRRYISKQGRNKAWDDYVKENGFIAEIIYKNLSNEEALTIEIEVIKENPDSVNKLLDRQVVKDLLRFKEYLEYDETSPTFLRWKRVSKYSKKKVGDIAGYSNPQGYVSAMCNDIRVSAHRFIWTIFNEKEIPDGMIINHMDCNPANNNISNLECVSYLENARKKSFHISDESVASSNKTGVNGVLRSKTKPSKEYWSYSATWVENESPNHRSFSVMKYGEELAFEMACSWRKVKEIVETNIQESLRLELEFEAKYASVLEHKFTEGVSLVSNHGKPNQCFQVTFRRGSFKTSKRFSVNKYGYDEALRLAVNFRKQLEENYN